MPAIARTIITRDELMAGRPPVYSVLDFLKVTRDFRVVEGGRWCRLSNMARASVYRDGQAELSGCRLYWMPSASSFGDHAGVHLECGAVTLAGRSYRSEFYIEVERGGE
jgi:hypothetical protein